MRITRDLIRNLPDGTHWYSDVEPTSMKNLATNCSFLRRYEDKVLHAKTFKDGRVKIVVGNDGQGLQNAPSAQQGVVGEGREAGGTD